MGRWLPCEDEISQEFLVAETASIFTNWQYFYAPFRSTLVGCAARRWIYRKSDGCCVLQEIDRPRQALWRSTLDYLFADLVNTLPNGNLRKFLMRGISNGTLQLYNKVESALLTYGRGGEKEKPIRSTSQGHYLPIFGWPTDPNLSAIILPKPQLGAHRHYIPRWPTQSRCPTRQVERPNVSGHVRNPPVRTPCCFDTAQVLYLCNGAVSEGLTCQ